MGAMLLRQSADNGRYFATPDGRIRYLSGGYEGSEFQDYVFGGGTTSDFQTALDVLSRHGGNLLRLWTSESSSGNPALRGAMQMPWVRSAVCCAADGANKFDLSKLDVGNLVSPDINANAYFERMRARVLAARAEGVYVSIMLWHSFGWEAGLRIPGSESWTTHPFNSRNNVNDINGDVDGDGRAVDHDAGPLGAGEQAAVAEQHLPQVVVGGHHDEHDIAAGQLGDRARGGRAAPDQRGQLGRGAVPHPHRHARVDQAAGGFDGQFEG